MATERQLIAYKKAKRAKAQAYAQGVAQEPLSGEALRYAKHLDKTIKDRLAFDGRGLTGLLGDSKNTIRVSYQRGVNGLPSPYTEETTVVSGGLNG